MREAGTTLRALSLAGCCLLALVTLSFTVLVEYRNWKADQYLPRLESEEGAWRLSSAGNPAPLDEARDELRGTVLRYGLPLYLLAPMTILWSAIASADSFGRRPSSLPLSMTCLAVGIMSILLMTSLHVLESLG